MTKIIIGSILFIGTPLLLLFLLFKLLGMLPLLSIWRNFFLQPIESTLASVLGSTGGDVPRAIGLFGLGAGLCFAVIDGLSSVLVRSTPMTNDVTSLRSAREKLRLM